MKTIRSITEVIIRWLLTFSGGITSITIIFIIIFLFKEGLGFFSQPNIESGYAIVLNTENKVEGAIFKAD